MAPSVAIIGAGPAGLTLARLLQVNSPSELTITIFEKDASPSSRPLQGGTLDLHPDTGIAALKQAGLWELGIKHMRYEGEEMVIADKNATELIRMKDAPKIEGFDARPEIDRERLKELLLDSVKPEHIKWGKHLRTVDGESGALSFDDGTTAGPFDLIIGADGAWSKVRRVLTDVKPRYAGIGGFQCQIDDPNKDHPDISKFVGRGSYFALSDNKTVISQRMGDESIRTGVWFKSEENFSSDMLASVGSDEEKLKEKLLQEIQDWAPKYKDIIRASHQFILRPLHELPVGHRWDHKKGYTLIGDSASLMTPFAGEGVNKAMKDALELSQHIIEALKSDEPLDDAVRKYEEEMFPRAEKYQVETMRNKNYMFDYSTPVDFMTMMTCYVFEETGWSLEKGFLAWTPLKPFIYSCFWSWTRIGYLRRALGERLYGN